MDITYKYFFSSVAIVLTFVAFIPYIRSILSGETKPHVFSWVIWGSSAMIVFFAQLKGNAGVGAWPIGVSAFIASCIGVLAYVKNSDVSITRSDWGFFILAMASLPVWYITSDPVWAVVILTIVDLLGFGPTFRKAYELPYEENVPFFVLFLARNAFAILALENHSVTTVLFPLSVAIACSLLLVLIIYRRRVVTISDSD